jgi:hypothetical protein
MRSDIIPGAIFPDYELSDHTSKRAMNLVFWRGAFLTSNQSRRNVSYSVA